MGTINLREVPDEIHFKAKASAALEGKDLKSWIIEAMLEKLNKKKESE